jgi:hypothetical protein
MTRDEMWKALRARGYMPYVPTLQVYYRQWFDDEEGVVQFPLYDFRGMLAGYQTYRPGAPKFHENPKMARYFTRARQVVLESDKGFPSSQPVLLTSENQSTAYEARDRFWMWLRAEGLTRN